MNSLIFTTLAILLSGWTAESSSSVDDAIVYTVATNKTDGYKRYLRSIEVHDLKENLVTLGMGQPWRGGDVKKYAGGGQKINLLKTDLEKYKDDTDRIIVFTDSYDVIFTGGLKQIIQKFKEFDARVLFSSEVYCWPVKSLTDDYPEVSRGNRFLNSGAFIGYASDIYNILTITDIEDDNDDQLFYTKVYLDPELRKKFNIKLDHKSEIFLNLNGATKNIELLFKGNDAYVQNTLFNNAPLVLHGNGASKKVLNSLGNYVAKAWSPEEGCLNCWDETIELDIEKPSEYPRLLLAVFVLRPSPFFEEFLAKIDHQEYPKDKIHLFIYNTVPYHDGLIQDFIERKGSEYTDVKQIRPADDISEIQARELSIERCLTKDCSGYLAIDSEAHLDNEYTFKYLVEQQRGLVAPLLVRPYNTWSNFWGAMTDNGFYARSTDYMQIIHNERRGLWNVPYINNCYLINATILSNPKTKPIWEWENTDADIVFALTNSNNDVFMYVSNRLDFGHLVNPEKFNISMTNPEMYEIFENKVDWEERYIHENYSKSLQPGYKADQPCPDVYWFPIVSSRFTKDFVDIMEAFGKWSDGSNSDPRLSDGYEAVPTRDIHMKQVGLDKQWLEFLKEYIRPLQETVYLGYYHNPPRSLMNFIVRYRPDEQRDLKPHHDSSTYTINIALNQVGDDYEGGGCRFIRYNCSVRDTKPGWLLMHPGRLTHYHEGLTVTKGTRYIMISFVDP